MADTQTLERKSGDAATEHFDVLIAGAGISGIGAAYHLKTQTPGKRFVILESQESFGGTWLTHKYPGIRSDSDLYTFGYRFKPWTGQPIAAADKILTYMQEVIDENDISPHIRYHHTIMSASWSSKDKQWTVEARRSDTGETVRIMANFLWMCQGYYDHAKGFTPEWEGMDDFKGRIVHPQTWPEDLDYKGKRVIVIGSGATAATVVPAIVADCAHVTLLQRSPTYFIPGRNENELADELRKLQIDETWIHEIVRRKVLFDQNEFTRRAVEESDVVKEELLAGVREFLGPDFDVAKHFTPAYRPWQQRIAFVPDGDLFQGIASGKASVVTDHIERFTEKRHSAEIRRGTGSGHHRDRDRLQPIGPRRHSVHGRQQAGRFCQDGHLSRHDVHGRAEHGLGVRLFPRQLDPARGPDGRLHRPAAEPYGRKTCPPGRGGPAARR